MKFILAILIIVIGYVYMLNHTTNIVLNQAMQIHHVYQQAANYSDNIANSAQ
jgi:hypothetical protein